MAANEWPRSSQLTTLTVPLLFQGHTLLPGGLPELGAVLPPELVILGGDQRSAALTQAKRELMTDERTAHPFYWAAFVVSGK